MSDITVESVINKDRQTVWDLWTGPEHIEIWNHASDDWECPHAENDLREGGKFLATMAAKDGSEKFDFGGTYTHVDPPKSLSYKMDDGRKVSVMFEETPDGTRVVETFETESTNSEELQRNGWQSILNNFKQYVESK
jgi:uncharacterized protein YndB with AHSA1/START domain